MKRAYAPPRLTDHGDVRTITQKAGHELQDGMSGTVGMNCTEGCIWNGSRQVPINNVP